MRKFPKVLIISEFSFNRVSGGGLLFSNLFEDFPDENIALIHEDLHFKNDRYKFCFCIKGKIFFFSTLFNLLPSKLKIVIKKLYNSLVSKFLLKKINKTGAINNFIDEFKPDIIYTILGNNEMMRFIKGIVQTYNFPVVTHIMDDFINYENNIKNEEQKELFNFFIKNSTLRLAINNKMCSIYSKNYGFPFYVIHNGLDRNKIQSVKSFQNKIKKITYIGSVYRNAQLQSIIDVSFAVSALNEKGKKIKLNLYFPKNQIKEFEPCFPKNENVILSVNDLGDEDYFSIISKSDLLMMAANFDKGSISYYKLSWPAKMASYLMSGIPIFIYGPENIYFINEAKKKNWALVCNKQEKLILEDSICKILYDKKVRHKIIKNALNESKNFELRKIKNKFRTKIIKLANLK